MFFVQEGFTYRNFLMDMIAVFAFVVWFWLLIVIYGDLFRRHAAGQHHFIVMVIKAKLAETSTPSLAPRSSSTTPFSLRNLTPETPAATAAPPPTPV